MKRLYPILVFVAFLLIFVVFPGFIAGIWSRSTNTYRDTSLYEPETRPEKILFTPAALLCRHTAAFRFYKWQYDLIGGKFLRGSLPFSGPIQKDPADPLQLPEPYTLLNRAPVLPAFSASPTSNDHGFQLSTTRSENTYSLRFQQAPDSKEILPVYEFSSPGDSPPGFGVPRKK